MVDSMRRRKAYFEVPMLVDLLEEEKQASERLDGIHGGDLRKATTMGLGHLANVFPDLREDRMAKLIGPFRSIVAAIVSGPNGASAALGVSNT